MALHSKCLRISISLKERDMRIPDSHHMMTAKGIFY